MPPVEICAHAVGRSPTTSANASPTIVNVLANLMIEIPLFSPWAIALASCGRLAARHAGAVNSAFGVRLAMSRPPRRVALVQALRARPRPAVGVGLGQHPSRFASRAQRDGSERSR